MRGLIGLSLIAFLAGLGAMIGYKMSPESLAVVVGVVMGVLASIPASVLLLVVARKMTHAPTQPQQSPPYPPVIVVGGAAQLPAQPHPSDAVDGQWWPAEERPRFRVLGEDME